MTALAGSLNVAVVLAFAPYTGRTTARMCASLKSGLDETNRKKNKKKEYQELVRVA
jgi:hypothetical protein